MPVSPPIAPTQVSAKPPDALGGSVINCTALDNLYTKLQTVTDGDTLLLEGGASFNTTTFPLGPGGEAHSLEFPIRGTGWKAIRPTTESSLPAEGTRIVPASHAAFMPKLVLGANTKDLLITRAGMHGWRITGLEVTMSPTLPNTGVFVMAIVGQGSGSQGEHVGGEDIGHLMWLDRVYFHGETTLRRCARGLDIKGQDVRLSDSVFDDLQNSDPSMGDGQAVRVHDNGQGPARIENTYMAGSGQCLLIGSPEGQGLATRARNISILRCVLEKKLRWNWLKPDPTSDGVRWVVKPCIEVKWGELVRIDGCETINSFAWHANTFDGVLNDIEMTNCFDHGNSIGFYQVWDTTTLQNGPSGPWPPGTGSRRFKIYNCLALNVHADLLDSLTVSEGALLSPGAGSMGNHATDVTTTSDVWVEHCTAVCYRGGINLQRGINTTRIANNIMGYGNGAVMTYGDFRHDDGVLNVEYPNRTWANNALVFFGNDVFAADGGATRPGHPASLEHAPSGAAFTQAEWGPPTNANPQFFVMGALPSATSIAAAGIDPLTGQLQPGSPLRAGGAQQATDGTANGVDFQALSAALAGTPTAQNTRVSANRVSVAIL